MAFRTSSGHSHLAGYRYVFLASFLLASCSALVTSSFTTADQSSKDPAVQCKLHIMGQTKAGAIQHASLNCFNGSITAVAEETWLGDFSSTFQGVTKPSDAYTGLQCYIPGCMLTICGNSNVVLSNSIIQGVRSKGPLRLLCIAGTSTVIMQSAIFAGNKAKVLKVTDNAQVTITDSNISNNTSSFFSGVGLSVDGNATLLVNGRSRIEGNIASNTSGAGLYAEGTSKVTIAGQTSISNNHAFGGSGGGLIVGGNVTLALTGNSIISNNSAYNASGGGVAADGNSTVLVAGNSRIERNAVQESSGGGLIAGGNARVIVTGSSSISHNIVMSLAVNLPGVPTAGGAGVAAGADSTVMVMGDSRVAGNMVLNGPGGGFNVANNATLILDGHAVVSNNSCINHLGGGLQAIQHSKVLIGPHVRFINNTAISGALQQEGDDIAVYDQCALDIAPKGTLSRCSSGIHLGTETCSPGEIHQNGACRCCPLHTYSLLSNSSVCDACPAHAECSGGDTIDPLPGYFHSSPYSTQVHRCPLFTEACGERGTCVHGYTSNMCGACQAPDFGITTPLRCGACMAPEKQLGLYALMSCLTVLFIAFTVHFTRKDNLEGSKELRATDLIKVLVQFLQYLIIIGSVSAPWPPFLRMLFKASSVVFGVSAGTAVSLDCWLAAYQMSANLPLSIQRQLVYFIAPVVVLVTVTALDVLWYAVTCCCCRCREACAHKQVGGSTSMAMTIVRRLPVIVLVVVYYSYPSLVKASLSFFACLRIDDANKGLYSQFAVLNSTRGYWVSDIQQACFVGWHKAWALGLGVVAVLVLCVGVPLAIFWGLQANKAKCDELSFREHYGFLYRNFHGDKVWWEAVWALQTIILTAISVFHFSLEAYYSILLLGLAHLCSAGLLVALRPYTHAGLHRLHILSIICLFMTTWGALALFTVDKDLDSTLSNLHVAIGVLIVVMDTMFVCWCLYIIASAGGAFRVLHAWLVKACRAWGRMWHKRRRQALCSPCECKVGAHPPCCSTVPTGKV